ncbi:hypothetical protein K440DRAFT_642538 [Wilcoxina mikolae CBS 423.85]|nr:hypothetical protein K440DRAFT_642538 [Wilcoxina mikolae CBS 423.85]
MAEIIAIVGTVAGVISAFAACDVFVKKIQERRKRKKKLRIQQRVLAAEYDFHESTVNGKRQVEDKYRHGIRTIGKIFAKGDDISESELHKVTKDMNENLVYIVRFLCDETLDILSVTEYERLKATCHRGSAATVNALTGLFQRKSQAAPIPRVVKLYGTKA